MASGNVKCITGQYVYKPNWLDSLQYMSATSQSELGPIYSEIKGSRFLRNVLSRTPDNTVSFQKAVAALRTSEHVIPT